MFNILANSMAPLGRATDTENTAYTQLISPRLGSRIAVVRATFTVAATAHTLTVLRPISLVLTAAAAAKDQADLVFAAADVDGWEASDYCAIELEDGTYQLNTVDSESEGTVTFSADLDKAVKEGARVFYFGDENDDHETAALTDDSEVSFESEYGYFIANNPGWPVLLHVDNATNASTLEGGVVIYSDI